MIVFADTSALFALLVRDDYMHVRAKANFEYFVQNDTLILTSSYVLL
jgi:predicted nucleic acid-binding protein